MAKEPEASGADDAGKCWLLSRSADLLNEAWRRGSAKELGLHTSNTPLIEHIQVLVSCGLFYERNTASYRRGMKIRRLCIFYL